MAEVELACIGAILLAFVGGVLVTFIVAINCEIRRETMNNIGEGG